MSITGLNKGGQSHTSSRGSRGEFSLCLIQLVVETVPWLLLPSACFHIIFSVCTCVVHATVCVLLFYLYQIFPCLSLVKTCVIASRAHLYNPEYSPNSRFLI